jgi:hypothetical protein
VLEEEKVMTACDRIVLTIIAAARWQSWRSTA